jgi:spoIIIJ-associated protein
LELLAMRLANKVVKTRRSVKLEPMNPYERKVIHATLQNHPHVMTKSEGQDPYRRVIIELKN